MLCSQTKINGRNHITNQNMIHKNIHIHKHDLLHSANDFHISFSECGRHFALKKHYWDLFSSRSSCVITKFQVYQKKTLAHCGRCCAQSSPGSAPFTQHQIILIFPGLSEAFLFIISYSTIIFHYIHIL